MTRINPGFAMTDKKKHQTYHLKVTLRDIRPPIWRQFRVSGDITLDCLHQVLQAVMGWTDTHLHLFRIDGVKYGEPDPEFDDSENPTENEMAIRLDQVISQEGKQFKYLYDFGDGWEHAIIVEKISPQEVLEYPVCIGGARACPPEDCGGVNGYKEFTEALRDPRHERHSEPVEWLGKEFRPEHFDLEKVNHRLKLIFQVQPSAPRKAT